MKGLYYLFGILCLTYYSDSKPNGAPQDSCFYMTPRHIHPHTFRRVFPTKAMGLYNITTSADVFRPDRPIRVTLWGPPFKGFMMVAAEEGAKDWPCGIFYSEDGASKRLSCLARGDTVTHQNNSYKDSVSVLWYGPENMMSEQIQFIATVVVNLTIYYTNIRSGMLRLDPSLHGGAGAGGEGGAPAAVTMDPWLSGQSVTQAPTNWWGGAGGVGGVGGLGGLGGAGVGSANTWGSTGNTGWGPNTGADPWGTNTAGTWGTNQAASGGWGQQNTGNSWTSSPNTGWGGGGANTAGTGSWGNNWGSATPNNNQAPGNTWGNSGASSWSNNKAQSQSPGTGNSWSANGDWQQWGQGSVTSRTVIQSGTQWLNSDGTPANNGQKLWNAPGDGRAIWHWNSGKISSTQAPKTTPAPKPTQQYGNSAWSANDLLSLLQNIGLGGGTGFGR